MNALQRYFIILIQWISLWFKHGLRSISGAFPVVNSWMRSPGFTKSEKSEKWKNNQALSVYYLGDDNETKVTVQTSLHAFHVNLQRLSECSEYFRALSQSGMRETSENFIHLDSVSSSIFHNFLEFSFYQNFKVPKDELATHIRVSSYLLADHFLSKCLSVLEDELNSSNCLSYLSLAQELFCVELKTTVLLYLSKNLLELPHIIRCLKDEEKNDVIDLRTQGDRHICSLRKENLTSWKDPETQRARHIYSLQGQKDGGDWHSVTELPFVADKWCFTTVVLFNYLYVIGGYRKRMKKGWEFSKACFRYNPLTHSWVATSPLTKHRRHFSAVVCDGCIYAVGGWYLYSLVTPDSSTALYTAVECYDPWEDTWRFVSSLPLSDFQFTISLSHDVPLATSLGHCIYVLGSIQRTGEKLLLQYNTKEDSWSELLPTLTRADVDLPTLYFLGATDKLLVIGGNNTANIVTSFCVKSKKWGQVQTAEKVAFIGQGTLQEDQLLMPSFEHNTIIGMNLRTLSLQTLPALPVSTRYEAIFYLHF